MYKNDPLHWYKWVMANVLKRVTFDHPARKEVDYIPCSNFAPLRYFVVSHMVQVLFPVTVWRRTQRSDSISGQRGVARNGTESWNRVHARGAMNAREIVFERVFFPLVARGAACPTNPETTPYSHTPPPPRPPPTHGGA